METKPQQEHLWLEKLVGEWDCEMEASMGPGQPPTKYTGTDSVRSLRFWIQCEGRCPMPDDNEGKTVMTLGYDAMKKRFVGNFIGSMMSHQWIYEGELDAAGKVLTLDTEGPSFSAPEKIAKYQDIIELKSDDHRILTSQFQGDDGQWHLFMTAHYRRK